MASAPQTAVPDVPMSRCRWCGGSVASTELSCPACGATVERSSHASKSGWTELPPIRDMARIRAGNSTCQIEGTYVPVADFKLAAGDTIYFTHHVLLWRDPEVEIKRMSMAGAFSRLMGGMPIVMTEAHGPGHIAFSRDEPGEMIALPLHPGQAIDVREHMFLAATSAVKYGWFSSDVWFTTRDDKTVEYHYPVGQHMDRFTAAGEPGLLLLHAAGNVFVRQLAADQTLLIKPTSLVYKDPTVQMALVITYPIRGGTGLVTTRLMWLHLSGPGRVAVQSAYEPMEDNGFAIVSQSPGPSYRNRLSGGPSTQPASAPIPQAPQTNADPRYQLIAEMAMTALAKGTLKSEMPQILAAGAEQGLSQHDVMMIIRHMNHLSS